MYYHARSAVQVEERSKAALPSLASARQQDYQYTVT